MLEKSTARSGQPIARINGIHLHSPYDPEKEAQRFIRESVRLEKPSSVLLLGAGLGYLYRAIRRSYPSAHVVVIFYHESVWKTFSPALEPGTCWHPGASRTPLQFLRDRIHELEAEGLAVVEWPASARAFPEISLKVNQALHQLFREIRGTLVTTAAMGRRWLRNSLINFLGIDEIFPPASGNRAEKPIVIAASGPSLGEGIDFLAPHRQLFELWALPSSVDFLLSRGIIPDTVVLTDPSYYAFTHLQCAKGSRLHLTMPLSAAAGSWRIAARVSLVNQDSPVERALLERAGMAPPAVPALGTVAATALHLALQRPDRPVVLAGLDLCYRDIISHVRPNNFERWLSLKSSRLSSLHHRLFVLATERAPSEGGRKRKTPALDTYAGWFAEIGHRCGNRIYRFHPSEVELQGIDGINEPAMKRLLLSHGKRGANGIRKRRLAPIKAYPPRESRKEIVSTLLNGWIERAQLLRLGIGGESAADFLESDESSLSLLYLCNAARFSEARRTFRLQGREAGLRKTSILLENHTSFLEELHRRVTGRA